MKSARIARIRLLVMGRNYSLPTTAIALSLQEKVELYVARIARVKARTKAQERTLRRYYDAAGREV
jgi:hypothetical protein